MQGRLIGANGARTAVLSGVPTSNKETEFSVRCPRQGLEAIEARAFIGIVEWLRDYEKIQFYLRAPNSGMTWPFQSTERQILFDPIDVSRAEHLRIAQTPPPFRILALQQMPSARAAVRDLAAASDFETFAD
jgi:hypothetical protein